MKRATYTAFHNVFIAVAVFVGAMFGALIIEITPPSLEILGMDTSIPYAVFMAFFISSLLRLSSAILFIPLLREARLVRKKMSARELVFRVTRFNAFSGLLYEVVGMFRKNAK